MEFSAKREKERILAYSVMKAKHGKYYSILKFG